MKIFKYIVIINFLIVSDVASQKIGVTVYGGVNRASLSNHLIINRNPTATNSELGLLLGAKVDFWINARMNFVCGLGLSNRNFSEPSQSNRDFKRYRKMYFVEVPIMLRMPIHRKFYTSFGLLHSYKFGGDTHLYFDRFSETFYNIDVQLIAGYRFNKKFGIEVGALYGNLLDHVLGKNNFAYFVSSLSLTYKLT